MKESGNTLDGITGSPQIASGHSQLNNQNMGTELITWIVFDVGTGVHFRNLDKSLQAKY